MATHENIKNLREFLNLTLEDLSEDTSISIWSLEKYENCELDIPKVNLIKIASSLGTTVDDLLYGNINIKDSVDTTSESISDTLSDITSPAVEDNLSQDIPSNDSTEINIPLTNKTLNIPSIASYEYTESYNYDFNTNNIFDRFNNLSDNNKEKLLGFLIALENS